MRVVDQTMTYMITCNAFMNPAALLQTESSISMCTTKRAGREPAIVVVVVVVVVVVAHNCCMPRTIIS